MNYQVKQILTNQSMTGTTLSSAVSFDPHMTHDDVGVVAIKVSQDSASAVTRPSTTSVVELQGSFDGSNWLVIARFDMNSTMTTPDFYQPGPIGLGTNGGYISATGVVQLFPNFRVKAPVLANATLNVWIAER